MTFDDLDAELELTRKDPMLSWNACAGECCTFDGARDSHKVAAGAWALGMLQDRLVDAAAELVSTVWDDGTTAGANCAGSYCCALVLQETLDQSMKSYFADALRRECTDRLVRVLQAADGDCILVEQQSYVSICFFYWQLAASGIMPVGGGIGFPTPRQIASEFAASGVRTKLGVAALELALAIQGVSTTGAATPVTNRAEPQESRYVPQESVEEDAEGGTTNEAEGKPDTTCGLVDTIRTDAEADRFRTSIRTRPVPPCGINGCVLKSRHLGNCVFPFLESRRSKPGPSDTEASGSSSFASFTSLPTADTALEPGSTSSAAASSAPSSSFIFSSTITNPKDSGAISSTVEPTPHGTYASSAAKVSLHEASFTSRYLALRQYIEVLRYSAGKTASTTWNLKLRRDALVMDMLQQMAKVKGAAQLWRKTNVSFVNTHGWEEAGIDDGGLTAEMHAQFWRDAVSPACALFDHGAEGGRLLPRAGASLEHLRLVGLMLCKSMLDDHPIGPGIARFLFEFLVLQHHGPRVFANGPQAALQALADFDAPLASQWSSLLEQGAAVVHAGLTMSDFADHLPEERIDDENLGCAIVAGCQGRLLDGREAELRALRDGFQAFDKIDLTVQLASLSCDDMLRIVQGKLTMSPDDLLRCFDWTAGSMGFPEGSRALEFFRTFISDATEELAFKLLRWCTGLRALPAQGALDVLICLEWDGYETDAARYPVAHTCSREVQVPNYNSYSELRTRFSEALLDVHAGFHER